jgi:double-strand break repair protein MRE11
MMGEVSLQAKKELDPEDPKIDDKVTKVLVEETRYLVYEAREKLKELRADAKELGNDPTKIERSIKYKLEKPEQVLVRLKVEHSGFSTLNNQRFGSTFVGEVANPVSETAVTPS